MIERIFQDISEDFINGADQHSVLIDLGWYRGTLWDDLLQSQRVMIISEAGAGKTYECRSQAKRLWDAGEAAFFLELAALAKEDPRRLLSIEEEARLDVWLSSQSDVATFFLDSIDELKLTLGSFEHSLKRLGKCIGNNLDRVRIVITTRPTQYDRHIFQKTLPVPIASSTGSIEETFASIAMGGHKLYSSEKKDDTQPKWRTVALMPLSDNQIIDFALEYGVTDPNNLLEDLQRRNAQAFARRPQDLIELCADWSVHKRIRTHLEQVKTNVRVKLLPREDRVEPAELSIDKAIDGASRLALAMLVTRRLTIRHSSAADAINSEASLDPTVILSDWQPNERKALLERSLFGFASYGRVRFHHRSVAEYLASKRLSTLRKNGMSFRALKRLLFAETKGNTIVLPSKRPIAGWLALKEQRVHELLRDNEPSVLLDEGDPESLTDSQREQALRAFCSRYATGGWRGINVPYIQVHRFASRELSAAINQIWLTGIESPDVREVLISLIEAGRLNECADIVFNVACDASAEKSERIIALDALVAVEDVRLKEISMEIVAADARWSNYMAGGALLRLFPKYIKATQLCDILRRIERPRKRSIGNTCSQLPRIVKASELSICELEILRKGLVLMLTNKLVWCNEWPHISSKWSHLCGILAAACERGLDNSLSNNWLHAASIAIRLNGNANGDDASIKSLRERLSNLSAEENSRLFWLEDSWLQSLHEVKDPWKRFSEITDHDGSVHLKSERDLVWVKKALADTTRDSDQRALLLEAAIRLCPNRDSSNEHIEGLRCFIEDDQRLVDVINDWLMPSKYDKDTHRREMKRADRKKQEERKKLKNHASWILFWREVANQPDDAFASEQSSRTAWNLWQAMRNDGEDSRAAGWNRRFIEDQFNVEIADKLRRVLMKIWRDEKPTVPSERSVEDRSVTYVHWQLGLAAIYAEAEDTKWTNKLSDTEAELATRYALIEMNGLPSWMEDLAYTHKSVVAETLGSELAWELRLAPDKHGHAHLIHALSNSPTNTVRLIFDRIDTWLTECGDLAKDTELEIAMSQRLRQVVDVIFNHGEETELAKLHMFALARLRHNLIFQQHLVWLMVLMRINPAAGVEALANQIETVEPAVKSMAVRWFSHVFGDRQDPIGLANERFNPHLLVQLVHLAYKHVRIQDDVKHEGSYTPDMRDDAENARNRLLKALFEAKGEEGLAVKLELATDPLCAHIKDRILAVADEYWAQEFDTASFDESQALALDQCSEAPAVTNLAMFAILQDRLLDLDELLLRDDSPRDAWAGISDEKIMRREIARELRNSANSMYTVDQEAVTADEKETDIRLRSVASDHEAVIELKLADGRTLKDLQATIEEQLLRKYMASKNRKSGALLVTLAKDRSWRHPDDNRVLSVDDLFHLLRKEADRVQEALAGSVSIVVHFLDLRPRLATERSRKGFDIKGTTE